MLSIILDSSPIYVLVLLTNSIILWNYWIIARRNVGEKKVRTEWPKFCRFVSLDKFKTRLLKLAYWCIRPVDSLYNFTWNNTKPLTTFVMVHVLLLLHFLVLFLVFFVTLIEITRGDSTESTLLEHIFLIVWPFPRLHLHQSKVSYVPIQRTAIHSCMEWIPSIMKNQY